MDLRFDLQLDTATLKRNLQTEIDKKTKTICDDWVHTNFQVPGYWNSKPGEQYLKIKYTLDSLAGNKDTQDIIQSIIEAKWEDALRKATEEAINREAMKVATKALKKAKNIPQYVGS